MMAAIRNKDTGPERAVRSAAHALGFRFRLYRKDLLGRPDLAFPKLRKVIFVHGCFWHRHENCPRATTPRSNHKYWIAKFAGNLTRDGRVAVELKALGWEILVIWECELKYPRKLQRRLQSFLRS
jgi:DNA mismatch endonuclease, patch repair protein